MKKIYASFLLLAAAPFAPIAVGAQNVCDPAGDVIIYSNYDGGPLTINVDVNIPNLKIGVASYEFSRIVVTGPFASNVTMVWYAGYNANNDHCNLGAPLNTTISAGSAQDSIEFLPAPTLADPNGDNYIIYGYQCSSTPSSGNTPEQLVHYFTTKMNGTFRYHQTQYGCWGNVDVSAGGNCCLSPFTTSLSEGNGATLATYPNPADVSIRLDVQNANAEPVTVTLRNMLGEIVYTGQHVTTGAPIEISTAALAAGLYTMEVNSPFLQLSRLVSVAH
jgi:hypothetical protein